MGKKLSLLGMVLLVVLAVAAIGCGGPKTETSGPKTETKGTAKVEEVLIGVLYQTAP